MEGSLAMNGGDGPNSYTLNSKLQGRELERTKDLLSNSIREKVSILPSSEDATNNGTFRIADLGCSVGPNTFTCVQSIIEAVKFKYKSQNLESKLPEFHVFFNDHVANDFNTLFKALPADRQYTSAGVPGSFHGRLFPKASMNFVHSSFALHWLSKIPEELTVKDSPAWNKGRITYLESSPEVVKAYNDQFLRDMEDFFSARSVEMAVDGLMAILLPCRLEGTLPSESMLIHMFERLGYALKDMAKEGLVDEELVDTFNLPIFIPTPSEIKKVVLNDKHLIIEKMEKEVRRSSRLSTFQECQVWSLHVRAAMEGIMSKHFGPELMDELFERYTYKLEEFSKSPRFSQVAGVESSYLLVRRC